ncbi:MAG: helix-turn-helix transcriptional regulator [Elusimicrobia bacterium]|nr:helix-turn-helix transcriptional regulator [Elusimicrobiota bacterium]
MPKQTRVPLPHRRALARLLTPACRPHPALRLEPDQWVRTVRAALHMSQAQLAKRAEISQAHVALIERGRVDPRVGTLRRIFAALFCDFIVLPVPLRRPGDIVAERTMDIPTPRIWD